MTARLERSAIHCTHLTRTNSEGFAPSSRTDGGAYSKGAIGTAGPFFFAFDPSFFFFGAMAVVWRGDLTAFWHCQCVYKSPDGACTCQVLVLPARYWQSVR